MRSKLRAFLAMSCVLVAACAADSRLARARTAIASSLPASAAASTLARIKAGEPRFLELLAAVEADREASSYLVLRVDKATALPASYAPPDLLPLDGQGLSVSRSGLLLRAQALEALKAMDRAARGSGISLLVSSAYRSYAYQEGVWDRGVAAEGEAATARVIARPGHSQHQLGLAIDFGSIDDSFAGTPASAWLLANARRFGFSQSYPKGLEEVTGYKWESWHYRYVGKAAAAMEAEFFGGVQQYLVLFLEAYKRG